MRLFTSLCLVAMISATSTLAQTPAPSGQPSPGTTSGPAASQPTTLGTGGETTSTKHMQDTLRGHGGAAVRKEHEGQAGGTSVAPSKSDAGAGAHMPSTPK
jgi:hypothetical protein